MRKGPAFGLLCFFSWLVVLACAESCRACTTAAWCRRETVVDLVRARWGWLLVFFAGLMLAAVVVEAFESILKQHVELSYFVPLLIGHGGNTGSQSNATIIRALALGHLRPGDYLMVVWKVGGYACVRVGGATECSPRVQPATAVRPSPCPPCHQLPAGVHGGAVDGRNAGGHHLWI
jgi:hypothetical protein